MADHCYHTGVYELLSDGLAGFGVGLVVDSHDLKGHGFALDLVAFLVDFFCREVHTIEQVLAEGREVAAQRLSDADFDDRGRGIAASQQPG